MTCGRTASTQHTAGDDVQDEFTCSQKPQQVSSTRRLRKMGLGGWGVRHLHVVSLGRVHRTTAKEVRRKEPASMVKEALDTGDADEKEKVEEPTAESEQLTERLKDVLGHKLKSTSKELMDIDVGGQVDEGSFWSRCQVKWEVFAVLPCQVSPEVDLAEGVWSIVMYTSPCTVRACLSVGLVTDAPTLSRWLRVVIKTELHLTWWRRVVMRHQGVETFESLRKSAAAASAHQQHSIVNSCAQKKNETVNGRIDMLSSTQHSTTEPKGNVRHLTSNIRLWMQAWSDEGETMRQSI